MSQNVASARITARLVPFLIICIITYVSWAVTQVVTLDYLLNLTRSLPFRPQHGAAIGFLFAYYLTLLFTLMCYARLLYTIEYNPGYLPRGPHAKEISTTRHSGCWVATSEHTDADDSSETRSKRHRVSVNSGTVQANQSDTNNYAFLQIPFWQRNYFACEADGRPRYCNVCDTIKIDRASHCSDVGRCVMKLDHFCPWVGGVVAETSFKFFIQFLFYAAIYCGTTLIATAYFFAQRRKLEKGYINGHWIAVIALGGLFWLFCAGMLLSSTQFVVVGTTTVENLTRRTRTWRLAVIVNQTVLDEAISKGITVPFIKFPEGEGGEKRTFFILEGNPGENPWNLGVLENLQDVMGERIWDWLLPVKYSPCWTEKLSGQSRYLYRINRGMVRRWQLGTGLTSWDESYIR